MAVIPGAEDDRGAMAAMPATNEGRAVVGLHATQAKRSAVDVHGRLRLDPIHDLRYRLTRPVPHEDGHVIEIVRTDWDVVDRPVVQVHMTTTFPGRIRAWGLHQRLHDRLFVAAGLVEKAVDLKSRVDASNARDKSPRAPDVEGNSDRR